MTANFALTYKTFREAVRLFKLPPHCCFSADALANQQPLSFRFYGGRAHLPSPAKVADGTTATENITIARVPAP